MKHNVCISHGQTYQNAHLQKLHAYNVIHTHTHVTQRSSVTLVSSYPAASHCEGLLLCLQWFVCLGVTIALSILGGWHLYLISVSEITIEFYTNIVKRDVRKMKKEGKVETKQSHIKKITPIIARGFLP